MDFDTWLLFLAIAAINVVSPGPAILLAVSNSIAHSYWHTLVSSFGNICGLLLVSTISFLGVGALLNTSAILFTIAKIIGAGYLVYLGIRQIYRPTALPTAQATDDSHKPLGKTFYGGLFIALTNPKAILFFAALFPLFIDASKPILVQFLIMTASFMVLSLLSLSVYGLTFRWLKRWFKKQHFWYRLQQIAGGLFIVFGVGLLRLNNTDR